MSGGRGHSCECSAPLCCPTYTRPPHSTMPIGQYPLTPLDISRKPPKQAQFIFGPEGRGQGERGEDREKEGLNVSSIHRANRISIYFSYILPCRLNSFTRSLKVAFER